MRYLTVESPNDYQTHVTADIGKRDNVETALLQSSAKLHEVDESTTWIEFILNNNMLIRQCLKRRNCIDLNRV